MADLIRRNPFGDLSAAMDRMFDAGFSRPWRLLGSDEERLPDIPIEVSDSDAAVEVKASLPGVKAEDIQIEVEGDRLRVRAESRDESTEQRKNYYHRELAYGAAERVIVLPAAVQSDRAEATFDNGVLRLRLPKLQAAKSKQIKVQSGSSAAAELPAAKAPTAKRQAKKKA
jgi:HSP20 family protein